MDQSLATDLSTEISRAQEAETSLETALSTEVSYLISNTDLTAIDSFVEVTETMEHTYQQILPLWYDESNPLPSIYPPFDSRGGINEINGLNDVFVTQSSTKYGSESIYLNGLLLTRGKDYIGTSPNGSNMNVNNGLGSVNTFAFRLLWNAPQPGDTITIYGVYDNRNLPQ
jgi:hypothetical protein